MKKILTFAGSNWPALFLGALAIILIASQGCNGDILYTENDDPTPVYMTDHTYIDTCTSGYCLVHEVDLLLPGMDVFLFSITDRKETELKFEYDPLFQKTFLLFYSDTCVSMDLELKDHVVYCRSGDEVRCYKISTLQLLQSVKL